MFNAICQFYLNQKNNILLVCLPWKQTLKTCAKTFFMLSIGSMFYNCMDIFPCCYIFLNAALIFSFRTSNEKLYSDYIKLCLIFANRFGQTIVPHYFVQQLFVTILTCSMCCHVLSYILKHNVHFKLKKCICQLYSDAAISTNINR